MLTDATAFEARRKKRERDDAALRQAVARIERKPRDYLESVEQCARSLLMVRDAERIGGRGVRPRDVHAAFERLRQLFDDE